MELNRDLCTCMVEWSQLHVGQLNLYIHYRTVKLVHTWWNGGGTVSTCTWWNGTGTHVYTYTLSNGTVHQTHTCMDHHTPTHSIVVFPAPLWPRRAVICPSKKLRDRFFTAVTFFLLFDGNQLLYVLVSLCMTILRVKCCGSSSQTIAKSAFFTLDFVESARSNAPIPISISFEVT